MASTSLCKQCRQIEFEALLGPNSRDINDIIAASFAGSRLASAKEGAAPHRVGLGPFGRIRARSSECSLCALFVYIIESQGLVYKDAAGSHSLDSEDIYFQANPDVSYFAKLFAQGSSEQSYFVLRRLNITAHHVQSPDDSIASLDHVLQPCRIGEISGLGDSSAVPSGLPLRFGARKCPGQLDMKQVREWMEICQTHHGSSCRLSSGPVLDTFRLIDVQRRYIREFHNVEIASLDFLALSYVWGQNQFFRLKSHNLEQMKKHSSLDTVGLPQTILDSIEVAKLLEFQYLWVDALCIQQDCDTDKAYQIGKMADIYLSAFFTIVAAAGEGPERGLPGLRKSTRKWEQREVVVIPESSENEGLSVVNCLKSYPREYDEFYIRGLESVDINKWSRRAWTLQEAALSHRRLTFTDEQVFWTCQRGYFCEESYFEVPELRFKHFHSSPHSISLLGNRGTDPWILYDEFVDNYTLRQLTHDGDIFNAFYAVTQTFERLTGTEFLWGLPCSLFELGLMWETNHGIKRRTELSTLPIQPFNQQVSFPTWSWMGWKGQMSCLVTRGRQESRSRSFKHVSRSRSRPDGESSLWGTGQINSGTPSLSDIHSYLPRLTPERLAKHPDSHLLFFRAHTAHFIIRRNQTSVPSSFADYAASKHPSILDPRDGNRAVGKMCRVPGNIEWTESLVELIMIGRRGDPRIPEYVMPCRALVLQVEKDGDGIARRVNFGEVELEAWERAEPQFCLIALA